MQPPHCRVYGDWLIAKSHGRGRSAIRRGTASSARKREVLSSSNAEPSPKVSTCIVPHWPRFCKFISSVPELTDVERLYVFAVSPPLNASFTITITPTTNTSTYIDQTADQRTYITIPSAHLLTKHQHPPSWAAHPATARAGPAIK